MASLSTYRSPSTVSTIEPLSPLYAISECVTSVCFIYHTMPILRPTSSPRGGFAFSYKTKVCR